MLLDEPAAPIFTAGLQANRAALYWRGDPGINLARRFNAKGKAGAQQIEALLDALQVERVAFTQAALPRYFDGAEHHHHKVDSKARLTMGDLVTYALAKETGLRLFFQARISRIRAS